MKRDVESTLRKVVDALKRVRRVRALVLGGSRARETHTPASDIDVGVYYRSSDELDIPALARAAAELDDAHRGGLVTEIGGWGPWINRGGWLTVNGTVVDLLYRDADKVSRSSTNAWRAR